MKLDDVFAGLRATGSDRLDAGVIYRAAMQRRTTRVTPAALATAATFALVFGIGAGMTDRTRTAGHGALMPFAHSPSTILLGN